MFDPRLAKWADVDMGEPDGELKRRLQDDGVEAGLVPDRGKLLEKLFDLYVQPKLLGPVHIVDFPRETSPLAKRKPEDPAVVERFEPFVAGMELGNAFTELNDPREQRRRFEHQATLREGGERRSWYPRQCTQSTVARLAHTSVARVSR